MTRAYMFCSDNGCVYASPETAFAWQANSFRPDKIQRRVLQSALTWTARWTIPVIIISPMTCGSFGLRIRYADVISVSTNSQVDPSDVHRPMSPTNLFSVSSTIFSHLLHLFLLITIQQCICGVPATLQRKATSGNSPRGSRVFLSRVLRSDAMPRARSPDA